MSDPIREAAIEAAGKAQYGPRGLDLMRDWRRAKALADLAPLVDAVLAVAAPAYRAEGRESVNGELLAAIGWDHGYRAGKGDVSEKRPFKTANPYRADAEEGA